MDKKTPDSGASKKTKMRLRIALCELLKDKPKDKITVGELTEKAYLSRATFYLYYSNFDEFFDDSIDCVCHQFSKQLIRFLEDGAEKAKYNSKIKNLIIDESDLRFLEIFYKGFLGWNFYGNIMSILAADLAAYFSKLYEENFIKENEKLFRLFSYGYIMTMIGAFEGLDPSKIYYTLIRCICIKDSLFKDLY